MCVQAKLILWQQGPSALWSGVKDQRPVLVVEQACGIAHGPALRTRHRLLSEVQHPSLARVLGAGWSERAGISNLLLERVPGVPVAAIPFSVTEEVLLGALEQLAGAIAACHRRGLALGSVHSGRVLLSRRPETTLVLTGAAPHGSEEQDLAGIAKVCRELAHQEVLSKPLQLLLGALERGQISAEHARRSASAMRGQVVPELRKAG